MHIPMKTRTLWIIAVFMAVISVVVPYTILGHIPRFRASYLFWTALTILIILIGYLHVRDWGRGR